MLRVEFRGPVLFLTLDRPEVRNAFNDGLIAALSDNFQRLPPDTRAVVLSGTGAAFSAGGDLEWMQKAAGYTLQENIEDAGKLARLFQLVTECPAIVVARVQGPAFGGGCGLVACADVAVASTEARFAFSEVRLGLLPATISRYVVPKIGPGHARALFTTGEAFDADKALRIGLVHEVVENPQLDEAVDQKLRAILTAGPKVAAAAKQLVLDGDWEIESGVRKLAAARSSDEGREGVGAFLEKRKAYWVKPWP